MNIFLAMPVGGPFAHETAASLIDAYTELRPFIGPCRHPGGLGPAHARNELVTPFLGLTQCSHLFFLDADLIFKPEDVKRLKAHGTQPGVDIIGATYPRKTVTWCLDPSLKMTDEELGKRARDQVWLRKQCIGYQTEHNEIGERVSLYGAGDRVEVDQLPTGFLLIDRSVFEKLAAHPAVEGFAPEYDDAFASHRLFFDYPVIERRHYGEDTAFCRLVRQLGVRIWKLCDTDLGHVGRMVW